MAMDESKTVSVTSNIQQAEDYDPSLDFSSELFDPLKALRTPGLIPPISDAKPYDNIAKYKTVYSDKSQTITVKAGTSKSEPTETYQRKWLPHQLPVRKQSTKTKKNIFTRMEAMKGPLALLNKCKDERIRIKVWTRNSHEIRGYCIGFVTLFDKHWNMVLEDVQEVWTRPKHKKIPAGLESSGMPKGGKRLLPPPVTIIKCDKKTETCERHIDQILVRGEQIGLVALLPGSI